MDNKQAFEEHHLKAIELLSEWSKWLIGINFGAATGCAIVLKTGVSETVSSILFIAVCFFLLSLITASFFNLLLAISLNKKQAITGLQKVLAWLQLLLFLMALCFLITWVWRLKESQKKTKPAAQVTSVITGNLNPGNALNTYCFFNTL